MDDVSLSLLDAAIRRFKDDYERYAIAGESKPMSVGMPRLLEAEGADTGMVLVHGYMAAPEEVAPLAERVRAMGITVYLPRLPGHGTAPDDLTRVGAADWVEAVEAAYDIVSRSCGRVVIAGFSTGASLALLEAERRPERYAAVISISAPLEFTDPRARSLRLADMAKSVARRLGLKRLGYDFIPNEPDNPEINYLRSSVHGMAEVRRVSERARRGLAAIRAPVLALQGSGDTTVASGALAMIRDGVSSARSRIAVIPSDRHGIVRGPSQEPTFAAVEEFLREEVICDL